MTFYEYTAVADVVTEETNERLKGLTRPERLKTSPLLRFFSKVGKLYRRVKETLTRGKKTPSDLNSLPIGLYLYLKDTGENFVLEVLQKVGGLTEAEALDLPVEQAIGFANFAASEFRKIGEALASQQIEPTAEEKRAGVEDLEGGDFALLDYIMKRQGCTLDEAEATPWPRVVAMLRADREAEEYRRRLQNQYTKK